MTTFEEYKNSVKSYDSDMWLGFLCWYAISEESHVDHGQFCGTLVNNGLTTHLPPVPRPSDVFKRCCTAAQRKKVPTDQPKVFENYLIREVGKDVDNIWRRVVREQVDTEGHTLGYAELAELHFYRPTSSIGIKLLVDKTPMLESILDEVEKSFQVLNNSLTPYAIRELVRKTLSGMNATVVRPSGGVYFVRVSYEAEVSALERVIGSLPGGSSFHSIPLVDDARQKKMLKAAFEAESIGELDGLLGEITEILKSNTKITSDRFAQFKSEYDHIRGKVVDYSDLLDDALVTTASRLEVMNSALFSLLGSVRV